MPENSTHGAPDPQSVLRRFQIELDDVRRHVMRPDHVPIANEIAHLGVADTVPASPPIWQWITRFFSFLFTLNVDTLNRKLYDILQPCTMGYALELQRDGHVELARLKNWSKSLRDGHESWKVVTPMHVASSSKLITAIAMTRLLERQRISYDKRIAPWLPSYWPRGIGIDALTFRHLLTHTSGLLWRNFTNQPGPTDYPAMMFAIADGSNGTSKADYKNVNYSLCRVLLATVNGDVPPLFLASDPGGIFSPLFANRDAAWDLLTTRAYAAYVNAHVFAPAGVAARQFDHPDEDALAYAAPGDFAVGWNSGDLKTQSGAVGWHLSVREFLQVLHAFRRGGAIVSPLQAQGMFDNGFGIDLTRDTRIGTMYAKDGWWVSDQQQVEQSKVFILPRSMELVILINSPA